MHSYSVQTICNDVTIKIDLLSITMTILKTITRVSKLFVTSALAVAVTILPLPYLALAVGDSVQVIQNVNTSNSNTQNEYNSGGGIDITPPEIINVTVRSALRNAYVRWNSSEPVTAEVKWGTTISYTQGRNQIGKASTSFESELPSLQPDTRYYFKITVRDAAGNFESYLGEFRTESPEDNTPPTNVSHFNAAASQNGINLSWGNPPDDDYALTRIVRSEKFYPTDPTNGKVVYEGKGVSHRDSDVQPGVVYYYTAFAKDRAGNYSSGSLAIAMIAWYSDPVVTPTANLPTAGKPVANPSYPGRPTATASPTRRADPPIVDLEPVKAPPENEPLLLETDFEFSYKQGDVPLKSGQLSIPQSENLKIAIPKSKIPKNVSLLTVEIGNPKEGIKKYTYLFAYNEFSSKYEVVLPLFESSGNYRMVVRSFNLDKLVLQDLLFSIDVSRVEIESGNLFQKPISTQTILFWTLIISIIVYLAFRIWHKRKQ